MNYEIGNPEMAWLLVAVPVVVLLCVRSAWLNRRCRRQFGGPERQAGGLTNFVSTMLLTSGVALLPLACMDIRWGKTTREVPQRGLEVVFALDVSRSMLAQDAKPNRLSRAKQQIKDMLAEMAGDRVGLVAFAGDAKQAVPLTNHYHDFQQKLDSVGPDFVSVGGSRLGVAIKAASEAFLSKTNDHKTIVLFTDGEDQESKPVELTKQLHEENGLRIFTVGLGDVAEGARIPNDGGGQGRRREQFVQHNGQQVWSKLNGDILKRIATESDAAYIPAGTKRVNMAEVYHRYIANVKKSEFETAKINAFIPRFQWFAFPAFVCLWLHVWLSGASANREVDSASKRIVSSPRRERVSKVAQAALLMCMCFPAVASGQATDRRDETVADRINAANELVRENKTTEAIEAYNAIEAHNAIGSSNAEHQDALNYNLANAHYRNSDIDAALALFSETAASSNTQIASHSRYNLGNCCYAKALPLAQQEPEAAIVELQQASQHFRSALRLDRSLSDARENLERATKLIQQLKQQLKEQQQQNEDQQSQDNDQEGQKSNEDQKSNKETDSQQQQKSDQTKSQDKQESDRGDQSQDDGSSQEEQSDSQSSAKADGENADQTSDQQDSGQQREQSDAEDGSNSESDSMQGKQNETGSQRDAENSPTSKQENGASEDESQSASGDEDESGGNQPPTGELSSVNPSTSEDSSEQENASGAVAQQPGSENGMMTRQEALKLLQAVRDRDMIRRYRQRQRQRQQRIPVEKDW